MQSQAGDLFSIPGRYWTVLYTQPRHEKKLSEYLTQLKISCYLPLLKYLGIKKVSHANQHYRYEKVLWKPMFPCYLFANISKDEEPLLWRSKSLVRILSYPDDTRDTEQRMLHELNLIRQIERLTDSEKIEIRPELAAGKRVMVASGAWSGTCGIIEQRKNTTTLIVNLEIMQRAVAAEIDLSEVQLSDPAE